MEYTKEQLEFFASIDPRIADGVDRYFLLRRAERLINGPFGKKDIMRFMHCYNEQYIHLPESEVEEIVENLIAKRRTPPSIELKFEINGESEN
jgi:hypothetical protein